jgi:CheY-like chemotaxis protein
MSGRILLVDGGLSHRRETRAILQHAGYEVLEAVAPEQATEWAREDPPLLVIVEAVDHPDLALKLTERLRRHPRTEHIPVLVLAREPTPEEEARLAAHPHALWVPEPCPAQHLLEEVQYIAGRVPPKLKGAPGELKPPFSAEPEA